jgi:CTP:molybdopterin cytidylyltransferase MocA
MSLVILLLAAGASSRMRGGDKLLEEVSGVPLIAVMAGRARQVAPVIITLPSDDHPRAKALKTHDITRLPVADADEGMAASIRAGAVALPDMATGVMILPGDMPELTTADLQTLANAWRSDPTRIHRATAADGTPGHPVIFPRSQFDALKALTGDTGARAILKSQPVRHVALPDRHALTDLDTPEDWTAWRARTPSTG